ncbi:cobalamin B12-binding domain-containing protein [Desulfosarcina ovata]|nr:cobalamin-dependent protein [Desulfosarcina ovata]
MMLDQKRLKEVMGDLKEEELYAILKDVMKDGGKDAPKAMDALREGMDVIGELYESGEYFVSDLIYAGELMTESVEILRDALVGPNSTTKKGKLLICTVEGDLHDIGKNIVKAMMVAAGFEVVDLGIDVKPEEIVKTAKEQGIKIIALSSCLTLAVESMEKTVAAFKENGMRDQVKILIGGNPVNEAICSYIGADAWAHSPQQGINTCQSWV